MSFRNWTMAEVAAHNARVAPETTAKDLSMAVEVESQLHIDILGECRKRGWIALHGSTADRTHRTIGEWDFVILADGGRVLLVECKTRTGKLTPEQFAMHAWARKLGHVPAVVRSMKEFRELAQ